MSSSVAEFELDERVLGQDGTSLQPESADAAASASASPRLRSSTTRPASKVRTRSAMLSTRPSSREAKRTVVRPSASSASLSATLLLESDVADLQDVVEQQHIHRRKEGYRHRQAHPHARREGPHRHILKFLQTREFDNLAVSPFARLRRAALRATISRSDSSGDSLSSR